MADLSLQFDPTTLNTATYGDLVMHQGDLVLTSPTSTGTDQTLQLLTQRLRLYLGEWFMDTSTGLPLYQQILVKSPSPAVVDAAIKDIILGCPGVQALTSYQGTAYLAQRLYRVTFTIVTATGANLSASVPLGA